MHRYTISMPDTEHAAATKQLPYVDPVSGEQAVTFSHLVRMALRMLPKKDAR